MFFHSTGLFKTGRKRKRATTVTCDSIITRSRWIVDPSLYPLLSPRTNITHHSAQRMLLKSSSLFYLLILRIKIAPKPLYWLVAEVVSLWVWRKSKSDHLPQSPQVWFVAQLTRYWFIEIINSTPSSSPKYRSLICTSPCIFFLISRASALWSQGGTAPLDLIFEDCVFCQKIKQLWTK